MEKILDEYALFLAYEKALQELYYKLNSHIKGVSEIESLRDDDSDSISDEIKKDASFMAIQGVKKNEIIEEIYNFLIQGDYIETVDSEIFKKHFYGELVFPKINFIKDLSLLIRLMDNLAIFFHIKFVSKAFKTARFEAIELHFLHHGKEINKNNWQTTRARFKETHGKEYLSFLPIENFNVTIKKKYCTS